MDVLAKSERELANMLFSIFDNEDFVLGVLCTLDGDIEMKTMIDYMKADGRKSDLEVSVRAIQIANARKSV